MIGAGKDGIAASRQRCQPLADLDPERRPVPEARHVERAERAPTTADRGHDGGDRRGLRSRRVPDGERAGQGAASQPDRAAADRKVGPRLVAEPACGRPRGPPSAPRSPRRARRSRRRSSEPSVGASVGHGTRVRPPRRPTVIGFWPLRGAGRDVDGLLDRLRVAAGIGERDVDDGEPAAADAGIAMCRVREPEARLLRRLWPSRCLPRETWARTETASDAAILIVARRGGRGPRDGARRRGADGLFLVVAAVSSPGVSTRAAAARAAAGGADPATVGQVDREVDRRGVARRGAAGQGQHGRRVAAGLVGRHRAVDVVARRCSCRARPGALVVRGLGGQRRVDVGLLEQQLGRALVGDRRARERADQEVDVGRAAGVPAGEDRRERDRTVGIGELVAAQPRLAEGRLDGLVGVDALGVGLPDVDLGAGDPRTGGRVEEVEGQRQRNAGLLERAVGVGQDVRAVELAVDEVRADLEIRGQDAGRWRARAGVPASGAVRARGPVSRMKPAAPATRMAWRRVSGGLSIGMARASTPLLREVSSASQSLLCAAGGGQDRLRHELRIVEHRDVPERRTGRPGSRPGRARASARRWSRTAIRGRPPTTRS